ncbi:succinate dehydrogenase, cytochrome b556 subunit [Sphingomonas sp. RS2018]
MATAHTPSRPRAPHLQVYKWGPHMLVSILHRATGSGMATVGTILFVWWLAAAASGVESYMWFLSWFTGPWAPLGYVLGVGLTWAFFQHMANGVRHLFMDMGANFELRANRASSIATLVFSVVATVAFWAYLVGGR